MKLSQAAVVEATERAPTGTDGVKVRVVSVSQHEGLQVPIIRMLENRIPRACRDCSVKPFDPAVPMRVISCGEKCFGFQDPTSMLEKPGCERFTVIQEQPYWRTIS